MSQSKILSGQGKNSWFNVIKRICDFGNITFDNIGAVNLEKIFRDIFKVNWKKERDNSLTEGKLGLLAQCKSDFNRSPYLFSKIFPSYKRALAKFRVSAHQLPIEADRYLNIPRSARVCLLGCDAIGNEQHYLMDCKHPGIKEINSSLLSKIGLLKNDFKVMSGEEKTVFILSRSNEELLWVTGKLCHKVLSRFNEMTR